MLWSICLCVLTFLVIRHFGLNHQRDAGVTGGGDNRGKLEQLEEIEQGASGGINGIGSWIIGSWMPRNLNW